MSEATAGRVSRPAAKRLPDVEQSGPGANRQEREGMSDALLLMEGLNVRYGSVQALFAVNVEVPEGRGIFPGLSVQENLRMAVRRVGTPDQRRAGVEHAYELFPRLGERRTQPAGTLSGGDQQMLALARALAVTPKVIIADEMSLGLAPLVVDFVFENIERASQTGVTIVLIEQFIHRALALASQCVILEQGSVAWSGPADEARREVLDRYLGESADAMS
jgi:branched-chain amino acid transport system ATP-binding protein